MKSVFVPSLLLGAICLASPAFAGDKAEKAAEKADKAAEKADKADAKKADKADGKGHKGKGGVCKEDRERAVRREGRQAVRPRVPERQQGQALPGVQGAHGAQPGHGRRLP
jgi:hypothetical protein